MGKYVYKPYDKEYPNLFKKEKLDIIHLLGKNILIEHVGSTSVSGLGGKGIIDIAILTPKNKLKIYISRLNKLGFEYAPSHKQDSRRVFMQKIINYKGKERRVHIHLCLTKVFFDSFILFRDYLIRNNQERNEYAKLKREGARLAKGDAQKYREHKADFIANLMGKVLNSNRIKQIYPKNKTHFNKLIPFAKEVIEICKKNGIEPVIYGSFAHFYHTKDKSMKVNDIDLLISKKGLKKLPLILKKNKISFTRCSPNDYSLIIKKGKLKLELDEVGTGYKSINEESLSKNIFEKADFYGIQVKIITLKQLEEIYCIAYNRSHDDKMKIKGRIKQLEKSIGRKIDWFNSGDICDGFEQDSLSDIWKQTKFEPGAVEIQSKIVRNGKKAAKITIHKGDKREIGFPGQFTERDELLERKELQSLEDSAHSYSFSIYLPKDFPVVPTRLVLAQWKQKEEDDKATVNNPIIALRYVGGKLFITLQTSEWENRQILFSTEEEIRGKWIDFRFDIKFTRGNSGLLGVWMNKKKIINYHGITAYSEKFGYPNPGRFYSSLIPQGLALGIKR